jgi:RNA polymerase sigma factor (sigma-70 family)
MAETETVLLRRFARTKDAEAFAEIIRRHAGLVYGAALRVLADMDRAADVAQDTFLQLTKDACSVTGSLPGWLHRVATHKAIDRMRRDASRRHRETEYAAGRSHRVAQWRDVSPYVDEGLNELDSEMRDILIAHFLEGRTTRHIAAVRGISQATVSRRIEAGVANLRGVLRRRGIIVGAGALSLLLGEKAVQAAPATLMSELGKIALVGGHAAVVSTAAAGGGSAGLQAVFSGLLASVQAKAVAIVSVAVIGAGSIVTYQHITRPSSSPAPETVAAALAPPMRLATGSPAALSQAAASDGMAVPTDSRDEPNTFGQAPRMEGVGMALGMCGGSATPYTPPLKRDPNDSNDRSDEGPNGGAAGGGNPSMAGPPRADEQETP